MIWKCFLEWNFPFTCQLTSQSLLKNKKFDGPALCNRRPWDGLLNLPVTLQRQSSRQMGLKRASMKGHRDMLLLPEYHKGHPWSQSAQRDHEEELEYGQPQTCHFLWSHWDVCVVLSVHMQLTNQESFLSQTMLPIVADIHIVTHRVLVASQTRTPVP